MTDERFSWLRRALENAADNPERDRILADEFRRIVTPLSPERRLELKRLTGMLLDQLRHPERERRSDWE